MERLNTQDGKELACIAEMHVLTENGERLSREPWIVTYADSEDVSHVNRSADKILICRNLLIGVLLDHYPHSVVIDLGAVYILTGIQYLPRMESEVARVEIRDFKIYVKPHPLKM